MDLSWQTQFFEMFYSGALALIRKKGPDYAPTGIPLLDALETAVDLHGDVPEVLWVHFRKHITAVKAYFLDGLQTPAEPVHGRLQDAINLKTGCQSDPRNAERATQAFSTKVSLEAKTRGWSGFF